MTKNNDIEKLKQYVSSKILELQSNHSKIISNIPTTVKNLEVVESATKILDVIYKEKIAILEDIYKEIQKIEKD